MDFVGGGHRLADLFGVVAELLGSKEVFEIDLQNLYKISIEVTVEGEKEKKKRMKEEEKERV